MKFPFFFCTLLFSLGVFGQSVEKVIDLPITAESGFTRHALIYTPDDYSTGNSTYPLLVFLHGPTQAGTDLSLIYNNADAGGPAYFIEHGSWPSSFTDPNNQRAYKFIIVSPQSDNSWNSSGDETNYMVQYLVSHYRIDTNRIYITGLSAGGGSAIEYGAHLSQNEDNLDSARAFDAAAIVTMSAATVGVLQPWSDKLVNNKIPAWGFGDPNNDVYGQDTRDLIDGMNSTQPGTGIFTITNLGHSGWGNFYTPNFKQTINGRSLNIYEWMLTNTRHVTAADTTAAPTVQAGQHQTITLPTGTIALSGTGQAAPGDSITYNWTNVSGPNTPSIIGCAASSTTITDIIQGTYVFRLTVTQNDGQTASDTVSVLVNPAPPPPPQTTPTPPPTTPVAPIPPPPPPADSTQTPVTPPVTPATPPADSTQTPVTPPVTPPPTTPATPPVTPPVTTPPVTPPVAPAPPPPPPPPPIPPVANAGPDQFITLPANTVTLNGSASTGTLTSYSWTKLSGDAATIIAPSSASTIVTGLTGGAYVFQLSVNGGASTSRVMVTVQAPDPFTAPGKGDGNNPGNTPTTTSTSPAPPPADSPQIKTSLLLYPNPATDNVALEISNELTGTMLVQLFDAGGTLRQTYSFQKGLSSTRVTLSISNLAHGLYFVRIRIGNWTRTEKLLKL